MLASRNLLSAGINGVNLPDRLRQIYANSCNLADGTSSFKGCRLTCE